MIGALLKFLGGSTIGRFFDHMDNKARLKNDRYRLDTERQIAAHEQDGMTGRLEIKTQSETQNLTINRQSDITREAGGFVEMRIIKGGFALLPLIYFGGQVLAAIMPFNWQVSRLNETDELLLVAIVGVLFGPQVFEFIKRTK